MEIAAAIIVVAVVVWFVSVPLRRQRGDTRAEEQLQDPRVAELEARKEAKYREIRDAELDREQGKLSQADWSHQDAELRRDAIAILKELDEAKAQAETSPPGRKSTV